MHDPVGAVTTLVVESLARGEHPSPAAVTLLIRQYAATGRADVRDALQVALADALDGAGEGREPARRHEWIAVFAEAALLSDDERLPQTASALAAALACGWPCRGTVAEGMRSVCGCLAAAAVMHDAAVVPHAIDELERIVAAAYDPGGGVSHRIAAPASEQGGLGDHLAAAWTLLAAFDLTARLPYSMLAEELIHFSRRTWWDRAAGAFDGSFSENCEAARVLCRLAALHDDEEYRRSAVVSPASDYAADARRIVERLGARWLEPGIDAAQYAIALDELSAYDKIHGK